MKCGRLCEEAKGAVMTQTTEWVMRKNETFGNKAAPRAASGTDALKAKVKAKVLLWGMVFCAGILTGQAFRLAAPVDAAASVGERDSTASAGNDLAKPGADPAGAWRQRGALRLAQTGKPEFTVQNVSGLAGAALPLDIALPKGAAAGDYTLLMFRGLPEAFKLSAGFRTKESWAVSLRDIQGLTLIAPPGFQGAFLLEVLLIKGWDTPPETRKIAVDIKSDPAASAGRQPSGATGSQTFTAAPPFDKSAPKPGSQQETAQPKPPADEGPDAGETTMLMQGSELLGAGDIARARKVFEHLALGGSGRGALALGQTYDPNFLKKMFVKGLKADPEKAKHWYRKAAELGNAEAHDRLSALGED